jgi:hypothetical protein
MPERFVDTYHCRSQAHCRTCRDLAGGRRWRTLMARRFAVPGRATDFDCPDGLPWNVKENDVPGESKPCGCGKRTAKPQLPTTRPSCIECVQKHVGAAWVLLTEARGGYAHQLLAIGHLHEAEDESQEWPELHAAIRDARKAYQQTGTMPDFEVLAGLVAGAGKA